MWNIYGFGPKGPNGYYRWWLGLRALQAAVDVCIVAGDAGPVVCIPPYRPATLRCTTPRRDVVAVVLRACLWALLVGILGILVAIVVTYCGTEYSEWLRIGKVPRQALLIRTLIGHMHVLRLGQHVKRLCGILWPNNGHVRGHLMGDIGAVVARLRQPVLIWVSNNANGILPLNWDKQLQENVCVCVCVGT